VFVAGGTGAVGRHTIPALVPQGRTVTALARTREKAAALTAQQATPVAVWLCDRSALTAASPGHEAVLPAMAAMVRLRRTTGQLRTLACQLARLGTVNTATVYRAVLVAAVTEAATDVHVMLARCPRRRRRRQSQAGPVPVQLLRRRRRGGGATALGAPRRLVCGGDRAGELHAAGAARGGRLRLRQPCKLLARLYATFSAGGERPYGRIRLSREEQHRAVFGLAADLLRDNLVPPGVQAAIYRALPRIPGVQLQRDAVDAAGRHGVAFARVHDGHVRAEIILDPRTYQYLGWRQIVVKDFVPNGTVNGKRVERHVAPGSLDLERENAKRIELGPLNDPTKERRREHIVVRGDPRLDRPAQRLPVPHPLLQGPGHLRPAATRAGRPRPRPPRRLATSPSR